MVPTDLSKAKPVHSAASPRFARRTHERLVALEKQALKKKG